MAYHAPADYKVCKRCGKEKPGVQFGLEPRNKDGLRGRCRECATIVRTEALERRKATAADTEEQAEELEPEVA